ncbi:hypothetical protein [Streptomyces albidoflavus]|uniref:hypothetical protein n=1 Tax=Streptomyces albidoflavus TaxID=1886 RepID=UPI000ADC467F|nr:hypothetical protein [Streptomyces albidoflavus]
MAAQWAARRRARRALRRRTGRFDVRLATRHGGIAFTARITPHLDGGPPFPALDDAAWQIREQLRSAAMDFAAECDPTDLAHARAAFSHLLGMPRRLHTTPPLAFHATGSLRLLDDDARAVRDLLAAQRAQAVEEALSLQKVHALTQQMAEPAAVLARWLEHQNGLPAAPPGEEEVQEIADAFARYRPHGERAVEHRALDLLRDFLSSFPDQPQKQMLYTVLAQGMHHAGRPGHAAAARTLLDSLQPPVRTAARPGDEHAGPERGRA